MVDERLPFDLPCEICELIFCRLEAGDLLNCVLVSAQWNNFVVQSKAFENLWLRIDTSDNIDEILATNRIYRKLRLVKLKDDDLYKCFQQFGRTAKRIEVFDCFATGNQERNQIIFKNLNELTISNVADSLLQPLMNFNGNLKILNLHLVRRTRGEFVNLIRFLQLNANIFTLNLYLNESTNVFQNDISRNLNFNLTSLTINFQSNFVSDAKTLANVEKFLVCQGESLKTISLINAASLSSVHRVWNYLRGIESLNFFSADMDCGSDRHTYRPKLQRRDSLNSLEFHALGPTGLSLIDFQPLLEAVTSLKSLGIWKLDEELLEFAAMNLMQLENISCATMENNCESFYNRLKSKSGVNKKLKLHQYL